MIVKLSANKFVNLAHVVIVRWSDKDHTCAVTLTSGPVHYLTDEAESEALRAALEAENTRAHMMHRIFPMPGQQAAPTELRITDVERQRLIHGDWHEPKD